MSLPSLSPAYNANVAATATNGTEFRSRALLIAKIGAGGPGDVPRRVGRDRRVDRVFLRTISDDSSRRRLVRR